MNRTSRSESGAEYRRARLLNQASKNPKMVLRDRRCHKPEFCEAFLEACDDTAFQHPSKAVEFASVGVELARKIGDPHLVHRAYSVRVHAHIAEKRLDLAEQWLEDYRLSAMSCCKKCSGDWLMRRADLAVESTDPASAHEMVERSRQELGDGLDADTDARLNFFQGIGCLLQRDSDGALDKVSKTLRDLELSSPRGYFLDSVAFIAWYLKGGARERHFVTAREILDDLRDRISGQRGWSDLRVRKSWVEGLVLGRLGDWKLATQRLESGRQALLKSGPPRHALAISLDLCQANARWINDMSLRAIQRMLNVCRRQKDLDPELRKQVKHLRTAVSWQPEMASRHLAVFRHSFIVPVPGLLGELALPILAQLERPVEEGEG